MRYKWNKALSETKSIIFSNKLTNTAFSGENTIKWRVGEVAELTGFSYLHFHHGFESRTRFHSAHWCNGNINDCRSFVKRSKLL